MELSGQFYKVSVHPTDRYFLQPRNEKSVNLKNIEKTKAMS